MSNVLYYLLPKDISGLFKMDLSQVQGPSGLSLFKNLQQKLKMDVLRKQNGIVRCVFRKKNELKSLIFLDVLLMIAKAYDDSSGGLTMIVKKGGVFKID
ncbi:hypothetical protein TNIN_437421 [Trichonephila inaurata madagascariensis]|uniref:Uncharacterized protein n=1 Tax=Trichonephila inaurata madagascariensis TaxID=2747483 RepID=A0A8X6XHS8_9ARAC|nr:hypothetical protein TNIN_437421 [Trichonephila inaurata madagascariensis]